MDMIEKVARAIRPEAFEPVTEGARTAGMTEFLEKCRERGIKQALKRARAAIEAMRGLDETTFALAMHEIDEKRGTQRESKQVFREFFAAVFDAALSNTREKDNG